MAEPVPPPAAPPPEVVERLAAYFRRNGYVRWPNRDRRAAAPRAYKKGYEVRLVADTPVELEDIRYLLRRAGVPAGAAFGKARQWRQPVYGKAAVARFLRLVGRPAEPPPTPAAAPTE